MNKDNKKNDRSVRTGVPKSAFEEALRAVENLERKKKKTPRKKVSVQNSSTDNQFSVDIENEADDLDSLLNILDQESGRKATKASSQSSAPVIKKSVKPPPTYELPDDDSILADLLGEEMDLDQEADFFRSVLFGDADPKEKEKLAGKEKTRKAKAASMPPSGAKKLPAPDDKQLGELTERLTRLQAEFENYRKRVIRDAKEAKKFYNEKLILELLPILDNFERAIEHGRNTSEQDSMLEGIQLIYRQLLGMLESNGLQTIDTEGEKFNPLYHEAVAVVFHSDEESGTVLTEYQVGYLLNGRLIRPSRVLVSTTDEMQQTIKADQSSPDSDREASTEPESSDSVTPNSEAETG